MTEDNIYVVPSSSSPDEDTQLLKIHSLLSYKDVKKVTDDDLLIYSNIPLPTKKPAFVYFFPAKKQYRIEAINAALGHMQFENPQSWNALSDLYEKILIVFQTAFGKHFDNIYFAINLSFGDFCVIFYDKAFSEINSVLHFLKPIIQDKGTAPSDIWSDDAEIADTKRLILHRANTQHIYNYTDCKELFASIFETQVDTQDRAWELLRQASVFLYTFLEESYKIWLEPNGELKRQLHEMERDVKAISFDFMNYYNIFLHQAAPDSLCVDTIWSFSFLCLALLSSIVGPDVLNNKFNNSEYYNDFHGFIPIVSHKTNTIQSFYCEQYGILYSIGFLLLPNHISFNLWDVLPAILHEFSHYIPTTNRNVRNNFVLKLMFCTVLSPLIGYLEGKISKKDINSVASDICDVILKKYEETADSISPSRKENNYLMDSMFFLNEAFNFYEIIDFNTLYDSALSSDVLRPYANEIPLDIKAQCVDRWDKQHNPALLTFTMALREIRSDIAMCIYLDIDLKKYILIMANEYDWAHYNSDYTADSVMLRFGFLTRYLFYTDLKKHNNHIGLKRHKFNMAWMDEVNRTIDKLKKSSDKKAELENMRGYFKQYIEINLAQEMKDKSETVVSAFEKDLFFMPFSSSEDEDVSLLGTWQKQFFEQKKDSRLINSLNNCYHKYSNLDAANRVFMNYRTRLILRDLYTIFPDIDM